MQQINADPKGETFYPGVCQGPRNKLPIGEADLKFQRKANTEDAETQRPQRKSTKPFNIRDFEIQHSRLTRDSRANWRAQ
jgi:hypothetical protein